MASAVVFWIVPPEPLFAPPPSPATVRPPLRPRRVEPMPFVPPVAEMRWKARPLAMAVPVTRRAGPEGAVVAPIVFVPVIVSVPLFVAVNVALAPFRVRSAAEGERGARRCCCRAGSRAAVAVMAPERATVPPSRFRIQTARFAEFVIAAPKVDVSGPVVERRRPRRRRR